MGIDGDSPIVFTKRNKLPRDPGGQSKIEKLAQ